MLILKTGIKKSRSLENLRIIILFFKKHFFDIKICKININYLQSNNILIFMAKAIVKKH